MSQTNGTVFRIEKTKDYTVMGNHHLRNVALSLKAKGLLSLMLSLPDNWDYSMNGLAAICEDGLGSVKSGIKELENHGYIRREQERTKGGQMGRMNFIVSEVPMPTNGFSSEFSPQVKKLPAVKPSTAKPLADNCIQSSTKELNTNISSINQSIFPEVPEQEDYPISNFDERLEQTEREIKAQIEYDILLERFETAQINELFELMLEVYLHDSEYLYIGKERKLTSLVKRRFAMLTFAGIESVIDGLKENTTQVKDMKAYLLACLYNAPATKYNRINSQVRHDLAELQAREERRNSASYDLQEMEEIMRRSPLLD